MRPWLALLVVACLAGCGAVVPTKKWQNGATLRVCFTEAAPEAIRQRIAAAAGEWTRWANLSFAFATGDGRCDAHTQYDITIGFAGSGSASLIGTDSRRAVPPSMTLGGFNDPSGAAAQHPPEFNRVVMHEFGHAIGLEHEFQRPDAHCSDRIDWTKAKAAYATHMGWTAAQTEANLAAISEDWQPDYMKIKVSAFDRASIMQYTVPAEVFIDGAADPCYSAQVNYVLSPTDKAFIAAQYPRPGAAAAKP